jgi:FHA domain/Double zinc ribbon
VRCSLGHENPDGSAFCDECGEPLSSAEPIAATNQPVSTPSVSAGTQTCPSCGAQNPAGEAFCSNCGANMMGTPAPAAVGGNPATVLPPTSVDTQAPDAGLGSAPAVTAAPTAAPAALTARLIVEADNQEFDLSGKDNVVIGREDAVSNIFPDVDLTPHGGEEGGVSRLHARIFVENGQYMIEDENSTNFTFVNRQRLAGKTPTLLHDNDEIKLGRVLLRFKTS